MDVNVVINSYVLV